MISLFVSSCCSCELHDGRFRTRSCDPAYDAEQGRRAREGFDDAEWEVVPRADEGSRFIEK